MFDNHINKHKGKIGIVFAHGPSGKEFLSELIKYSKDKENYCFIGLGELDQIQTNLNVDIENDYWVMANHEMNIFNSHHRFNKYLKTTLVWADSVDQTPLSVAMSLLKVPYITYDQRHFENKPCPNCPIGCRVLPGRLTIQEKLQTYTKYSTHYGTGSTVALHATTLAILLGCKEVRIYGVDLSYGGGYIDGRGAPHGGMASFDNEMSDIVIDFDIINKSAKNVGVKLLNYSKHSPLSKVIETI